MKSSLLQSSKKSKGSKKSNGSSSPTAQLQDKRKLAQDQQHVINLANAGKTAVQLKAFGQLLNGNVPLQKMSLEEEEPLQAKFETIQKQELEEEELMQGKFKTIQKIGLEEEEPLQGKFETIQKQGSEEEELIQGKFKTIQKMGLEEEEPLQGKFETIQKQGSEEEELMQGKFKTIQKMGLEEEEPLQAKFETIQKQENNTGLPDNLKSGIENLSGFSMDDVKVHYNSDKPAALQAHAYAQGTDIHIASGQEKHLPHEAWHVVQQKQGRVKPTIQLQGKVNVNDDAGLEKEADLMGQKTMQLVFQSSNDLVQLTSFSTAKFNVFQLYDDLNNRYKSEDIEGKEAWIPRFTAAQQILNDQKHVEHALQNLTDWMVQKKRSLSQALSDFEADVWLADKLVLTDFVPTDTFLELLQQGKIFEDLVGKSHGVHSHRIQWFILQMKLGAKETLELFKEAGNPRWKKDGKYMWDRIVDGLSGTGDTDFTVPDKLETYINNKYSYFKSWLGENQLSSEVHNIHELQPELKANIRQRFPKESEYTTVLKQNVENHKRLSTESNVKSPKDLAIEKLALNNLIEKEKVTNTTTVHNETKTIEWTGWIFTESSQLKDSPTYLTPTVGKIL